MQEGSTGTSIITRIAKPSNENLLKDITPYLNTSGLKKFAASCCSPDMVPPNDNISTSELPRTQESNSEIITNKLISTKYDTASGVKATHQEIAEYSHNSNSHHPSFPVIVDLTEDFCDITAEMLRDEERNYVIKEIGSGCTAGSVQALINDYSIQTSCNAEINTKENKSNKTQKISNNNEENHVLYGTENVNRNEDFLDHATGSALQTATDLLEVLCETPEVFSEEDRMNSIEEVSGCSSGDVQALRTDENRIQMSWNADITSKEKRSNSIQKVSNTTKESDAGNSTEMNSRGKFNDTLIGPSQHSKVVLETPYKTGQSCFNNSRDSIFIAPEIAYPEDGLQYSDFVVTTLGSDTTYPLEKMSSPLSASNESTGSLREDAAPTICTSRGISKCSSIKNNIGNHHNVAQIPAAKNSCKEQEEAKLTARKINDANNGTKKSEQRLRAMIYSGTPSNVTHSVNSNQHTIQKSWKHVNVPTKFLEPVSKFSQTDSAGVRKSYSTTPTTAISSLTPEQVFNTIMKNSYPTTVKRHLFSSCKNTVVRPHSQRHTATILLKSNQNQRKSNAKMCKIQSPIKQVKIPTKKHNKIYPKIILIPRNVGTSINTPSGEAGNSGTAEQSEGTKKKYTKSKIMRNDEKNDRKIKTKRAYIRKAEHVVSNNKSTTTPSQHSTDTDHSSSKESQKIFTKRAQHISHHNTSENSNNHFSCKSNQKSGKQVQTSKESTKTFTSVSSCEPPTMSMTCSNKPSHSNSPPIIMDGIFPTDMSTQYGTATASSSFENNEHQESEFEHSAPLNTEHKHNTTKVSDNIQHKYTAHHQEQMFQIQYNEQYFPNFPNQEALCTGLYENAGMWGETFKFRRNQAFPVEDVERHIDQPIIEHQLSDNIYHQCAAYDQEPTWQCQYNNQYFPSSQNIGELCTDMYNNGQGDMLKFNRNQELPQENVGRYMDQQNKYYETNIIQNGYQTVLPATETFHQEAQQKPNYYTSHNITGMQQTSNGPLTTYDDAMEIPIHSNSLPVLEAEFLKPQSQSTNNFRQSKHAQLSADYTKVKLETSKKKHARNERRSTRENGQRIDKPYICSLCGARAQYNVLLRRHLELHHGYTNKNLSSHEEVQELQ